MAYPSPYRAGMSSLGFQTLYRMLNEEGPGAHRAFLPDQWEPLSLEWPRSKVPILSYEDERPLSSYPIIAISVSYELEVVGLIRMLEGSGVPLRARDRGKRDPIVIIGGPITGTNASCILPFADVLIFGEGEELLPLAVANILDSAGRDAKLDACRGLAHTLVHPFPEDAVTAFPLGARVDKSLLPAYSAILTPDAELSDMFLVEPERGCSRRCTFCVMRGETTGGMRLLPHTTALGLIPEQAKRVGLVGAAVTDHPKLEQLVADMVDTGRGVGISSLRADRLSPSLVAQLGKGGYRTITVASDGISRRMREVLQRGVVEEDLLQAARFVKAGGLHKLKVYQMMGAPTETDEDADELVRFALELSKIVRLTLTFSTFVAKRNTPLDRQPFMGAKAADARLKRIRSGLKGKVQIRPQPPKWAYVEYELAQRGPEVARAAIEAVHAGGGYRAWVNAFEKLPAITREATYGDEARRAGRTGFAKERPRLPVLA
jgi:radical SAM superfamily enzyme YgiQ (UPF0313 family)